MRYVMLFVVTGCASLLTAADPVDPRRPTAIMTENVPVVASEDWDRLRPYLNIRSARFRGWAPDGRGILIQTQLGNVGQLHRVYEPGGRREQVTFFDEPVDGRFLPQQRDGTLLLTGSVGGNENDQVFRLDPATGRVSRLTDGTSRNLLGPVARDGSFAIVSSNRTNPRDMDLYRVSLTVEPSWELLLPVQGATWTPSGLSPDGSLLLLYQYVSINETRPAVLNLQTKASLPLVMSSEPNEMFSTTNMTFGRDVQTIFAATDVRSEFRELAELTVSDRKWVTRRPSANWDVEEIECDPVSGRLAVSYNENGRSAVFVGDGQNFQRLPLMEGIVDGLQFARNGTVLGFTLSPSNAPSDAWSFDLETGVQTQWTFSETGGLPRAELVKPALIEFPSFDQRTISAWMFKPHNAGSERKAPVLISIHGGPESQYRPYFSGLDQYYVRELGVAVIHPNVRGSAGYGRTYLRLDNAEKREDSVRDIGALLDWIATQPDLDASRVAVIGGSYGGYMVLASLTHYSDRLRCGVDIVGIANFLTFLERTSEYRRDLRRAEYGDERIPEMKAVFERINPSANAHKIRTPLLVIHGRNDPRVPFAEAEQIAPMVRRNDVPVWTLYADNEGHGFRRKDNRDYQLAVTAAFLRKFLTVASGP